MKVHAAIAKALVDNGVDTMFGLIGDGNLFMVDRWVNDYEHTRWIAVAQEAASVLAANGYANFTGKVGVATVTHGPALTNTVTALVEGVKGRTPILVIAGDTAVVDKYNFQNVPQRDVVLATGAGFEQMRSPATAVEDVAFAYRRAFNERRPVVLNMPYEFQWEDVEYKAADFGALERQAIQPDPAALDRAVGMIATAQRPIVLAGRGATSVEARAALLALADRLGAPVATTLKAKDLFRDEPYDLGIFGTLSHPVAVDTILAADCIIAFGAGLNRWTAAEGSYLADKRVVHVDTDTERLGYYFKADAGIVGDAKSVADAIVGYLDEAEVEPTGFRTPELAQRLSEYSLGGHEDLSTDTTVDLRTAILAFDAAVPRDHILVFDGGRFIFDSFTMFRVPDPRSFLLTINFGSIGLGLSNAIGAATAQPDRMVLHVAGDGGFMLGGLTEFSTACRNGLDIVTIVFNDDSYGAEHIQFRTRDLDPTLSLHNWPDLAPVADALGGQGVTIRNLKDLDSIPEIIANRTKPLLFDVKIDPDHVTRPDSVSAH
ncbi:MAG: thiamine pyrophosphate-binding protein [Acidimicrobiia bacterium]